MLRSLITLMALISLSLSGAAAQQLTTASDDISAVTVAAFALDHEQRSARFLASLGLESQAVAAQQCCKICTKGKACGDTCIARDKTCHQPPGCACNG